MFAGVAVVYENEDAVDFDAVAGIAVVVHCWVRMGEKFVWLQRLSDSV